MPYLEIFILALLLAGIALITGWLERGLATIPMLCLALGYGASTFGTFPSGIMLSGLEWVAEGTLAIVLFADAARLTFAKIRHQLRWPGRMLLFGMPLAVVIGYGAIAPFYPELSVWAVILLAALLVPTDAALGKAVFENPAVPDRVRDCLLAESGLNDGLALPFIIFAACATIGFDHELNQPNWLLFAFQQIGFGILCGVIIGAAGGFLLREAIGRHLAKPDQGAVFALMLILITYLAAELIGGNAFVAVFVSGLFFGGVAGDCAKRADEFLESDGLLLTMLSFVFIGAILLPSGLAVIDWRGIVVILLSLFLVRPLAVWLSLIGSNADTRSRLFLGWFGPRGLATALFAVIVLSEFADLAAMQTLIGLTAVTVAISTVLHGISAHFAYLLWKKDANAVAGDPKAAE